MFPYDKLRLVEPMSILSGIKLLFLAEMVWSVRLAPRQHPDEMARIKMGWWKSRQF